MRGEVSNEELLIDPDSEQVWVGEEAKIVLLKLRDEKLNWDMSFVLATKPQGINIKISRNFSSLSLSAFLIMK